MTASQTAFRARCGLVLGRLRWIALAALTPLALVAATIAVGMTLPGVTLLTDYGAFLLEQEFTQEQADEAVAELEAFPVPPLLLFAGMGLLAGATINTLAALGEELGWRGRFSLNCRQWDFGNFPCLRA